MSGPRVVLFLHATAGGYGADRQLEAMVRGLDPARHRPLVVLSEPGALGPRLEEAGIEVAFAPLAVLGRGLLRGRALATTLGLARRNARELGALGRARGAVIVHSNTSLVLCGAAVARRAGARHVQHVREIYGGIGGAAGGLLWPLFRRRLLAADAVACVSRAAAAPFGGAENVTVLHDAALYPGAVPTRPEARAALDVPQGALAIAVVGRISDWKGQSVLFRALAEPALAGRAPIVLVAGDTAPGQQHFRDELDSLRRRFALGDRIRFLGYRQDVATVLAAADVVAIPSTHPDAFPNTALEAAIAGLPIVASRIGGLPEIIEDDRTGRLVPPSDATALANALRELADDPDLGRRLGAAAKREVPGRFAAARLGRELAALYDRVADRPRVAWSLPARRLASAAPVATDLRVARFTTWLGDAGFTTRVFPPSGLLAAPALAWRAWRERPTLVLTHAAIHGPVLAAIKAVLGSRVTIVADVMGLHSLEVDQAFADGRLRPLARLAWRVLERLCFRAADLVLVVNDRHARLVRRRDRPERVFTLRDAAEPELLEIPPAERAVLGVPRDGLLVGFVGSLVYRRLDGLFAAWPRLDGAGVFLLVVGDGPELERYRGLAEREGWLGRSVFFLGGLPRREALAALGACDVAYSDCWSEAGFPAKLFEAMALGMAIVTEGKPQTREVLTDDESALFYRSPEEIFACVERLRVDPALRARLGAAARRSLLREHTTERRGVELVAILRGEPVPRPARPTRPRRVSVIVPILDGEDHVAEQLAALAAQSYRGDWELVVADNGCRDASLAIIERWRARLPALRVIDAAERRGLNHARNRGAEEATGDLLAFCDADDVVDPGWLDALVEAAPRGDLIGGRLDDERLNPPEVRRWRPAALPAALEVRHGFLPTVAGGNCAVWTRVARAIGWDESFAYGSTDIEFAWRLQLAGYEVAAAPRAVVAVRHRGGLKAMARQYFRYGRSEPQLYRRFRHAGMRGPGFRGAGRSASWLVRRLPGVLRSRAARGDWLRRAALAAGQARGSVRHRAFFVAPPEAQARGPHLVEFGVRWPPETFVARRLERLAAAGFRVSVASLDDAHETRGPIAGVDHLAVWRPSRSRLVVVASAVRAALVLGLRSPARALVLLRAAAVDRRSLGDLVVRFATFAKVARLDPDVIHFEWCNVATQFRALPAALGRPFVVSCHGSDLLVRPHTRSGRAASEALPAVLSGAARVHCASAALADAAALLGGDRARLEVIHAAVDPTVFRPREAAKEASAERFVVVAVGALGWVKGFEYAILAAAELVRIGVPIELHIVGGDPERDTRDASERERLEAAIADLGLDGAVRLHGSLATPAVRDRLQAADVYLQSSLSEGHPTAVIEAMACGLPIVATDCGGTREAIDDGVEGFLISPRDWQAAARALDRLYADPALRRQMGRAGRLRVEAEFTLDRQTERFLGLYQQVLAR